jgi:hypothetical protein
MKSLLDKRNPLPGDGDIEFFEDSHTYTWRGAKVPQSVTGMLKSYWQAFDGEAVVNQNFEKWSNDPFCKYSALIQHLRLVEKLNDDACKRSILKLWDAQRDEAAKEGTAMHADFQAVLESWSHRKTREVSMFKKWLGSFCIAHNCAPFRAELLVVHRVNGKPVVAGQIDFVLKHREKAEFIGVDFKRTNPASKFKGGPKNLLLPTQKSFGDRCGTGPFSELYDTDFNHYAMQLNTYAHIAATHYGIDFRNRMLLLQVHPDLAEDHVVRVPRLDAEVQQLFELEDGPFAV